MQSSGTELVGTGVANVDDRQVERRRTARDSKALPTHARDHNLTLLLRTLYYSGPLTRAELARTTGLTKVSISVLVAELIARGLLVEVGPSDEIKVGKRGVKLDLARTDLLLGGLDLSHGDVFRAGLFDLDLNPILELEEDVSDQSGQQALQTLLSLADQLVQSATDALIGIGVGAPGLIGRDGQIINSIRLGWNDLPLAQILRDACQCEVWVENDSNIAACAEWELRGSPTDLFLLSLWSGIGAGLVLQGGLVRGSNWAAGEIGRLRIPGTTETLETWLAEKDLQRRIEEAGPGGRDATLKEAGRRLGLVLAPVVATLNLSNVVLSVPPRVDRKLLVDAVYETLAEETSELTMQGLNVVASDLGQQGVMIGAAQMGLHNLLGTGLGPGIETQAAT